MTKSEWLIINPVGSSVNVNQRNLDPHAPIPDDADGNYVRMNESSFGLGLFPQNKIKIKIPGMLRYQISEPRKNVININVPFVPYDHFQCSRAYREGLSYGEYFEILCKRVEGDDKLTILKERWCKGKLSGRRELPIWSLPDSASTVSRLYPYQCIDTAALQIDCLCHASNVRIQTNHDEK